MIIILIAVIILIGILALIYIDKDMNISKKILLSDKFDDNIDVCRKMLEIIGNNHTSVQYNQDENTNLSYYNHSKDVIVLKRKKVDASRIVQMAHECIHTIQNKKFLQANKFFSNLQLLYFIFSMIYIINNENFEMTLIVIQILILLGTLFVKVVIEGDASYRSLDLAKKYLTDKVEESELENYITQSSQFIYKLMPIYYFNFLSQGMLMIIINTIMAIIK